MDCICRLAARGPSLQGLGFSGRFERLGGTDDAIPVQSSPVLSLALPCPALPCPVLFSCRSAARVTTCAGFPRSSPTIHLLPTVRCLLVTQPSATLGRIRAASTRHPCTDRPPQPRAALRSTRHGRCSCAASNEPCVGERAMGYCLRLVVSCQSYEVVVVCTYLYAMYTAYGQPDRRVDLGC